MKFLIVHIVVLGLIFMTWRSIKKDLAIDREHARYLFENADARGTVAYSSYDEMKRLQSRWNSAKLRMILKSIPLVVLGIIELIVIIATIAA